MRPVLDSVSDSAIPGLVNSVEDIVNAAINASVNGLRMERIKPIAKHWAREAKKIIDQNPNTLIADVWAQSYRVVTDKLGWGCRTEGCGRARIQDGQLASR